jgi:hypothetical protein
MHCQYEDEFDLFEGTNDHGRMRFGTHIYCAGPKEKVAFCSINNLYTPTTVEACFNHHRRTLPPDFELISS